MKRLLLLFTLLVAAITPAGFVNGTTACPSSGAVQLSQVSYSVYTLTVYAKSTNSGVVYLGGSGVTVSNGVGLASSASLTISKPNPGLTPSAMYFACSNSSDGVNWMGAQ